MAGRNRALDSQTAFRLPPELILITKCYQNNRRLSSLNAALKELLETHPAILAIMARSQYDNGNQQGDPERLEV
jgi:hypothetical protein